MLPLFQQRALSFLHGKVCIYSRPRETWKNIRASPATGGHSHSDTSWQNGDTSALLGRTGKHIKNLQSRSHSLAVSRAGYYSSNHVRVFFPPWPGWRCLAWKWRHLSSASCQNKNTRQNCILHSEQDVRSKLHMQTRIQILSKMFKNITGRQTEADDAYKTTRRIKTKWTLQTFDSNSERFGFYLPQQHEN